MPHTHEPDPTSPTNATRICPACGSTHMKIVLAKPCGHYTNLDECTYRCDCGEEAIYMVLRPD